MEADRSPVAAAPVIATKLAPPELPAFVVRRPALRAMLDTGTQVTSVVAPAGYGKTVCVRDWVSGREEGTAWYSLDALDASPLSFWRHLLAALRTVVDLGAEPETILLEAGADDPAFLQSLLHHLLERREDVLLVLDDLHLLRDRTALDLLALLVERAPPEFRLAFTARRDPSLPLGRWRARGLLTEIRQQDLRFAEAEASCLMASLLHEHVDGTTVSRLVARTEGWVTGLQLAALARPDHTTDGAPELEPTGRLVSAYLVNEVLDRLPEAQRDLALTLSVVHQFDDRLAAALSGREDAGALIEEMREGNVFLVALGPAGGFRFHQLFRELLEHELRTRSRLRWVELHRAAARLLVARGQTDAAISHLLQVDDVEAAVDLVVGPAFSMIDRGQPLAIRRWLEQLPPDLELRDPERMLALAIAEFAAYRLDSAHTWCERAGAHGAADDRVITRRLAIAVAEADLPACDGILSALGATRTIEGAVGDLEHRFAAIEARVHLLRGDVPAALAVLDRAAISEVDRVPTEVAFPALRARALAAAGHVSEAAALAAMAWRAAERLDVRRSVAAKECLIAQAYAAVGSDTPAVAAVAIEQLIEPDGPVDYPYVRAHAAAVLAMLHARQHGWAATSGVIDGLCEQVGGVTPAAGTLLVDPVRVRALAAAGRVDDAMAAADALLLPRQRALAGAACLLAAHRFREVAGALEGLEHWPLGDRVEALVLRALAGTSPGAEADLCTALELAGPVELRAPFAHRAVELAGLLARVDPGLRTFLGAPPDQAARPRVPAIVEPLTPRERQVLDLLPTHLSYAGIAERLYVSVNTVKTNLKAVYRKLGTGSRDEAVTRARDLGLLSQEPVVSGARRP